MTIRNARRVAGFFIVFGTSVSNSAELVAQGTEQSDSVRIRNWCRLATQVVEQGQPANKRPWAVRVLPICGSAASRTVQSILRRYRMGEENTPALDDAASIAAIFKDAGVFSTALEIAQDRSAGSAARVQALRIAYFQVNPGASETYQEFTAEPDSILVIYDPDPDAPMTVGTPLPPDAAQLAAAAGRSIRADPTAPEKVKRAARWILRTRRTPQ
jgi:hypothetical protein